MFKSILALASIVVLTACSSGGGSSTTTPQTPQTPPAAGDRAGTYIGDFGSGNGVYIIDNNNSLTGLALAADGSANSLFGNIGAASTYTGTLSNHYHDSSNPAAQGIFGAGVAGTDAAGTPDTRTFNLNILDGQTIESLSGTTVSLNAAAAGDLAIASESTLAGTWSGQHRYCGANQTNCNLLVTEITFSGTTLSGRTYVIQPDDTEAFEFPITGTINPFNDVSLLSFTWNGNTYNGAVFFLPGNTSQVVFIGETTADASNKTIASLLSK